MCEVSESSWKPEDTDKMIETVEKGLRATKLLSDDSVVVSRFHTRLEYGYPTPFYGRDKLCNPIQEALKDSNILSRGRFGAWKYEISNQVSVIVFLFFFQMTLCIAVSLSYAIAHDVSLSPLVRFRSSGPLHDAGC
jgi:hypothetical protein